MAGLKSWPRKVAPQIGCSCKMVKGYTPCDFSLVNLQIVNKISKFMRPLARKGKSLCPQGLEAKTQEQRDETKEEVKSEVVRVN